MIKKVLSVILVFAVAFAACSCGDEPAAPEKEKFSEVYWDCFDTVISMTAYCDSKEEFDEISNEVYSLYKEYNALFDIYNDYGNLNNAKTVNEYAGISPVEVDDALIELLEFSIACDELTGGNVNIAFGSVLSYWHEAREIADNGGEVVLPSTDDLRKAAEHCDINNIEIDRDAKTVFLTDPEMSIDLGAVAKGFATQKIVDRLISEGRSGIVISAGGNAECIGNKPDGSQWTVAVQNPDGQDGHYAEIIQVTGKSVVTSGTYERYFELDGRRYHHIINKDTLMPENNYQSVTIVTEDSALADALSTAVFNMELEDGKAFIELIDEVEAMWILNDETKVYSSGFEKMIKK